MFYTLDIVQSESVLFYFFPCRHCKICFLSVVRVNLQEFYVLNRVDSKECVLEL